MLPVRLEIKNFLAYRDPVVLQFDGIHLACLTGPNGAGKSSLLDAITWAVWGKARGNMRADELMHLNEHEMLVQLDFAHEGAIYRVIRKRTRKGAGTTTLDLYARTGDGSWNAIGETTVRATEAKLNHMLRLDYDTFTHSAFLQQGKADSFTTLEPARRKETLAEILGVSRFEAYERAAKEQAQAAKSQIDALTAQLADIEQQLSREPELVTEARMAEEQHAAASAALAEADMLLREVEHVPQALRDERARAAKAEQTLGNSRRFLADAQRKLAEAEREVRQQEAALAQREQVEAGYQELQQARSDNQALAEKFEQFAHLRERIRDLEVEVQQRRSQVEQQISGLDARIAAAERVIREADPDAHARARDEAAQLEAAQAALRENRERLATSEADRAGLEATNKHLREKMLDMKGRKDQIEAIDGATCPLCGQPLDEAHRHRLMNDIQDEGTTLGDQFRANEAQIAALKATLKELSAARSQHEAAVTRLDGSQKQLARFEERAKRAQAAEAERDQAAAERAALAANLDAGGFAAELTAEVAALQAQRDQLGYDQSSHSDAKRRLSEYEAFEQAHQRLLNAEAALPVARRALDDSRQNLTMHEGIVANEEIALAATQAEVERLAALLEVFQQRKQAADDLRRRETSANEARVLARQALKALDDLRERRDSLTERHAYQREQRGIYDELAAAFGKNGIPAMLIETAIPEIEQDANDLLWKMTGGRMSVRITTQRERKSGDGAIETLDFLVADELGERSYDTFSGGEAFRVNFALRVALSQLLARRSGAHLRALFLDEGFGTQDEDGRARLVEAITAVQDRFDLILVITHLDDLRDSFPVHLLVTKTPQGSKVSIR